MSAETDDKSSASAEGGRDSSVVSDERETAKSLSQGMQSSSMPSAVLHAGPTVSLTGKDPSETGFKSQLPSEQASSSDTDTTQSDASHTASCGHDGEVGLNQKQSDANKPHIHSFPGNEKCSSDNNSSVGGEQSLQLESDRNQSSALAAPGKAKEAEGSQVQASRDQKSTNEGEDSVDDLSQKLEALGIGSAAKCDVLHRSTDSVDNKFQGHSTAFRQSDSDTFPLRVHTFASGKEHAGPQTGQPDGACSQSSIQKESLHCTSVSSVEGNADPQIRQLDIGNSKSDMQEESSLGAPVGSKKENTVPQTAQPYGTYSEYGGSPAAPISSSGARIEKPNIHKANSDSSETTDVQNRSSVTKKYQETQQKISVVFKTVDRNSRKLWTTVFPLQFDISKWKMLENMGIEDALKQLSGAENVMIDRRHADHMVAVINTRAMEEKEVKTWVEKCTDAMWERLLQIQTVRLCGLDISRLITAAESVQSEELHQTVDEDERWYTVCTTSPPAMDQFLKAALPLLNKTTAGKMLIITPLHPQTLMMLEHLGFRKYYEQKTANVKMSANFGDSIYVLDCHSDLRYSVQSEVNLFLDNLAMISFEVPDLYKSFLLNVDGVFRQKILKNKLFCWFRENQGCVKALSSSPEMLLRVKETVLYDLAGYTVWVKTSWDFQTIKNELSCHPEVSKTFTWRQEEGTGAIEIAGLKHQVDDVLRLLGTKSVFKMPVAVRDEKLPGQQDKSDRSGSSKRTQEQPDGRDTSPREQDRYLGTDFQGLKQPCSKDRSLGQENRSGSVCQISGDLGQPVNKTESSSHKDLSGRPDRPSGGHVGITDHSFGPEKRFRMKDKPPTDQNQSDSPQALTEPRVQEMACRKIPNTCDSRGQPPQMTAAHTQQAAQITQGYGEKPVHQRDDHKHGDTQQNIEYPISAELAHLLQAEAVLDKFKSKIMDKGCIINCQSVPQGYIAIITGDRDLVSSTLQELFCHYTVEVGDDDDQGVEETLKSFSVKHAGKVHYGFEGGRWKICVTSDIKNESHTEVEKLKRAQCLVPLPVYACEFLLLKIEEVKKTIKEEVDSSVDVCIPDQEKMQEVEISAYRKFVKLAVDWLLCEIILKLEVTEKSVTVPEALFFQDLKGQAWIQKTEKELTCRIDAVVDTNWSGLCATAPTGQQLVVCGDTMAATDCDCIVLPLWDGQTEWSSLQRWILRRSFLSEKIASYQRLCENGPFKLHCNGVFHGKTLIIVLVPEMDTGSKEKHQIREAYEKVFALCGEDQSSVAVCAKQSPKIYLPKSLKPVLSAALNTFSAEHSSPCTFQTVVIHTESALDGMVACQIVTDAIPRDWQVKPMRVPRQKSAKGIIKVCMGEIQKTEADVIVNTTNETLIPKSGAVEKAIARAAGKQMIQACQELYPRGIPVNGLAVTDSYSMTNAKKIYHIVLSLDRFQESKREILLHDLRQLIVRCLMKASLEQHASIAFPILGSGEVLGYPCDIVAKVMFSTINSFFTEMPHTTLQKVVIVVYPQHFQAIQALKMEEISQLYRCDSEQPAQHCEMRITLKTHRVQVIHGNVFNKPWVAGACIHAGLTSHRGESPSDSDDCQSVIVEAGKQTQHHYKDYLREAFKHSTVVQIAADTLRSDSLKDLASALEAVLLHKRFKADLVSVIFSNKDKACEFNGFFPGAQSGQLTVDPEKEKEGQVFVCSYKRGQEISEKIEEFQVPPRFKKMMEAYQKMRADQEQSTAEDGRAEKDPGQITIAIPNSLLENVNLSEILKADKCDTKVGEKMTNILVKLEDLVTTAETLRQSIMDKAIDSEDKSTEKEPERNKGMAGPESESSEGWSKEVDEYELEALRFLLGKEFDDTFDVKRNQDSYLLTLKGASSTALEKQVESLRHEDVQLTPEEVSKLGETVDVRSEGIKAFVKTVRTHDKATVFAFDYSDMTKAKHLVTVKAGRVRVTARGRRRFDPGNTGQQDQAAPQPLNFAGQGTGPDVQSTTFTTQAGIKVLVYITDITKLPVDAIANAANEHLAHGGGVAYAIAKAAGFGLENEGEEHIRRHGPLQVTEVVATTGGSLPCKKVLHAVGPRWDSYADKAVCRLLLVDTVFNCLHTAHNLAFRSIALPAISSAIFGVPKEVCAQSYLSAVKKFDDLHGFSTSLKEIHFVDISDAMISIIQDTFRAQWEALAGSSSSGNQATQRTAGGRSKQEESSHPPQNLSKEPRQEENSRPPQNLSREPRQEESSHPPQNLSKETHQGLLGMNPQPVTGHDLTAEVTALSTGNSALPQNEPVGFPCVNETGTGKEHQLQIDFKGLNMTVIFQKESVVDLATDSVILWQDVQNIMKDSSWKQFKKKLSAQAATVAGNLKKDLSAVDKVVCLQTLNKQFVFVTLSLSASYDGDKVRDFIEQSFNKADLGGKKTIAIPRRPTGSKGKASNKDCQDTEVFITSLYSAVKNYAKRRARSITEIHVAETDTNIFQVMIDTIKGLVGIDRSLLVQTKSQPSSAVANTDSDSKRSSNTCSICLQELTDPRLLLCGHVFCSSCIDQWFQTKPTCPSCNAICGILLGNQPEDGRMLMKYACLQRCDGFLPGTYIVEYSFPPGTQTGKHPSPGTQYQGTTRIAYLPDTIEGRKVLMLLKVAFDRRLTFTIDQSTTTGKVGIVWNDIHHKTQLQGGPASYGYPDPDYLTRVQKELADKGVTEKDLTDIQWRFIDSPFRYRSHNDFSHCFNR